MFLVSESRGNERVGSLEEESKEQGMIVSVLSTQWFICQSDLLFPHRPYRLVPMQCIKKYLSKQVGRRMLSDGWGSPYFPVARIET